MRRHARRSTTHSVERGELRIGRIADRQRRQRVRRTLRVGDAQRADASQATSSAIARRRRGAASHAIDAVERSVELVRVLEGRARMIRVGARRERLVRTRARHTSRIGIASEPQARTTSATPSASAEKASVGPRSRPTDAKNARLRWQPGATAELDARTDQCTAVFVREGEPTPAVAAGLGSAASDTTRARPRLACAVALRVSMTSIASSTIC